MKKVVINKSYGGFMVSPEVTIELFKIENNTDKIYIYEEMLDRDEKDPIYGYFKRVDEFEFDEFGSLIVNNECRDTWGLHVATSNLGRIANPRDLRNSNNKHILTIQYNTDREDLNLINMIERLGSERCSGEFAKLKIVEIPKDIEYQIEECEGIEWIAEKHRTWK